MREIRSSGSGEGPGRVTSRPTLQVLFTPRRPRRWRAAPHAAAERPAARQSAVERDVGWGWTGAAAGGRGRAALNEAALRRRSRGGAPLGGPEGTAAGRAAGKGGGGEASNAMLSRRTLVLNTTFLSLTMV